MDPLTAIAVAGNCLQFGQFVGDLLNNAAKIYASASGITIENEHIQDLCSKLVDFNSRLLVTNSAGNHRGDQPSQYAQALAECASSCRKDCEELIAITTKLKVKSGNGRRRWKSFCAALAEVWKSGEIEALRARIADRERAMTLQLCAVSRLVFSFHFTTLPYRTNMAIPSSENIQNISIQLNNLKRSPNAVLNSTSNQDKRLDELFCILESIEQRIDALRKHESLATEDVESLCTGLSQLCLDTRQYRRDAYILASLSYPELPLRHEKIPDAHKATLEWSLKAAANTIAHSGSLHRWLLSNDGLFWVSGKPGSGKSTFMKYIADSPATKKLLQNWSRRREPLVVAHYFTIYGTPIQRSLEGLLRSLLHGILKAEPRLIKKLFPGGHNEANEQIRWTQNELQSLLQRVAEEGDLDVKICFFVDGLDEYTGDHMDICQTLKRLSQSPSIKMCLSSRPWNVFEDALGDMPEAKLYMHELTQRDIRKYTESVLCSHPRWRILEEEESHGSSQSLVEEVVSRSNGVFLWVTLVIRVLREGLTNDDSLSDLQRRLSGLPSDLGPFFRHILESVDKFYSQKMAGTLLLALHAKRPLGVEIYMFHDMEYDDENYAFKHPAVSDLMPTSFVEFNKLFRTVFRRINGRCKGLLERNGDKVEFLHRTVYDFLKTREMGAFLDNKAKTNFCPSLSIFRAFVAWTKRSRFCDSFIAVSGHDPFVHLDGFIQRMRMALPYAKLSDKQGESSVALTAAILDNMESGITLMLSRGQLSTSHHTMAIGVYHHLILEAGIENYLRKRLETSAYLDGLNSCSKFRSPIFSLLIQPAINLWTPDHFSSQASGGTFVPWILKAVFDAGYSVDSFGNSHNIGAMWEKFILASNPIQPIRHTKLDEARVLEPVEGGLEKDGNEDWFGFSLENSIYDILLQNGADPNAPVHVGETFNIPGWALFLLMVVKMPSFAHYVDHFEKTLDLLIPSISTVSLCGPEGGYLDVSVWRKARTVWPFATVEDPAAHHILIRLFGGVLSKFAGTGDLYESARDWFQMALPESCHQQLEDTARTAKAKQNMVRSLAPLKREATEEKGPDTKRKRRKRRRG